MIHKIIFFKQAIFIIKYVDYFILINLFSFLSLKLWAIPDSN